jgi:hypothetical protein
MAKQSANPLLRQFPAQLAVSISFPSSLVHSYGRNQGLNRLGEKQSSSTCYSQKSLNNAAEKNAIGESRFSARTLTCGGVEVGLGKDYFFNDSGSRVPGLALTGKGERLITSSGGVMHHLLCYRALAVSMHGRVFRDSQKSQLNRKPCWWANNPDHTTAISFRGKQSARLATTPTITQTIKAI